MLWSEAKEKLDSGKCKGLTRLDLPCRYFITLFKYTLTWYSYTHGFDVSKPKRDPEDLIMYVGDNLDSPNRWVNLGMWNDDKWLMYERVWDLND